MKYIIVAISMAGMLNMTGCSDFGRGFASGAAVGAGTAVIANEGRRTEPTRARSHTRTRYSRNYYNIGYRNGCSSARGRWYKSSYYWRNFASYRNGWRAGYRRCR